jgi:hypothetical protein
LIPLQECENRRLYRVTSRNLRLAVYDVEKRAFIGIREKFSSRFAATEYASERGGTARPIEALPERLPDNIELNELRPWTLCGDCKGKIEYRDWEQGEEGNGYPGRWIHLASDNTCIAVNPHGVDNEELYTWLEEMEKRY